MQKEIGDMQKTMLKLYGKSLQKKTPSDYVISTGKQYTVKQFVNLVLQELLLNTNGRKRN